MWDVADFAYSYVYEPYCYKDANTELELLLRPDDYLSKISGLKVGEGREFSAWGWNMALQMHTQRDRWQTEYGLSIDAVPALQEMSQWVALAAPYLEGRSRMESIHLMQKLAATDSTDPSQVKTFFDEQPATLPGLRVVHVREKHGAVNEIKPHESRSWILAEGESLPKTLDWPLPH